MKEDCKRLGDREVERPQFKGVEEYIVSDELPLISAMGSIDIEFEGFLVDAEAGEDPETVWLGLGQ